MKVKAFLTLLLAITAAVGSETVNYLYCDAEMNKNICDMYFKETGDLWKGQAMALVTRENFGPYTQNLRRLEIKDKNGRIYTARSLQYSFPNSWTGSKYIIANKDSIKFEDVDYVKAVLKPEDPPAYHYLVVTPMVYLLSAGAFYAAEWGQSFVSKDFDWRRPLWYAILPTLFVSLGGGPEKTHIVLKFRP